MGLVAPRAHVRGHLPFKDALKLMKFTNDSRFDNFDEYTRRQYNAKAPHIPNPFGHDEVPNRFLDFDVFQKLRVLHQLSIWTFWNPDRIRDKMPEQRENDQTQWVSVWVLNLH
jgi:DNA-directed RNA polymerase